MEETEMALLSDDRTVVQRILDHIDHGTTDLSTDTWREPVSNYRSETRLAAELELVFRRHPTPFCPSVALPEPGSYVARDAGGTPIVAVRDQNGEVRAFRNACRHRGMAVASGEGCAKAFVCRYHGWTYRLDGRLHHVPHDHGFPGLEKDTRGLVPVETEERHGLVFVTQDEPRLTDTSLDRLPPLIAPGQTLHTSGERDVAANWKIVLEGFLEGYHIRSTHRETFYPYGFDNVNLIETFGRNSRVTFPFRRISRLATVPPENRCADGMLTHVYHLFPNVLVATFSHHTTMIALEPLATDRTKMVAYTMQSRGRDDHEERNAVKRDVDFAAIGGAEDRAVVCAIQRGMASGANDFFEFGRFEGALTHFHRALDAVVDQRHDEDRSRGPTRS